MLGSGFCVFPLVLDLFIGGNNYNGGKWAGFKGRQGKWEYGENREGGK